MSFPSSATSALLREPLHFRIESLTARVALFATDGFKTSIYELGIQHKEQTNAQIFRDLRAPLFYSSGLRICLD